MNSPRLLLATALALGATLGAAAIDIPPVDLKFSVAHMDRSVAPGADFAKYAWGGWAARTEIPADKSRWSSGDMLGENNWARIRAILEDAAANTAPPATS
jgi:predicted metalloendopeptidase